MLTSQQFARARELALGLAGIGLSDRHRELLDRRSPRLGIFDLEKFLGAVEIGEPTAVRKFTSLLTTKFTRFFRHPEHFQVASAHALRCVSERGRARLWSAGAATGEEPYSLAMALIEVFQREDPPVQILATDIDVEALSVARRGEYSESTLEPLQQSQRDRFFTERGGTQRWEVAPIVRRLVEWRPLNLILGDWPYSELFDVIFCRNVLMYLEAGHRYSALERFSALLAPDGVFLMDPTEHLGQGAHLFASCVNGVCLPRRALKP